MASLQNISPIRAIFYAALILLSFLALSYAISLPEKGSAHITSLLRKAGFSTVEIGNVSLSVSGLRAENILLDREGFDRIQKIDIGFSWPSYLLHGSVDTVEITGLSLNRKISDFTFLFQKSMFQLLKPTDYRLVLKDAQFDAMTSVGDLRFTLNASIDPPSDNTDQTISAHLVAQQFQLGFDSKWNGKLSREGKLEMTSDIVDGRLHFGPMRITRYNGWIVLYADQTSLSLQSQMDAGGAHLFDIPMQDLSLVTDVSAGNNTVVFRSSMAGMPGVSIMADMAISSQSQSFDVSLTGSNLTQFLNAAANQRKNTRAIPSVLKTNENFSLTAKYQADRRFAGGPLPFSLSFIVGENEQLSGNFLIYAKDMDIRGSAEGKKGVVPALRDYFGIPKDRIQENFIRLDGDFEDLIKTSDQG